MKKFRFRLERVLSLRENQKRMVEQEVARNLAEQERIRQLRLRMEEELNNAMNQVTPAQVEDCLVVCQKYQSYFSTLDGELETLRTTLMEIRTRQQALEREVDSYSRLRKKAWNEYLLEYEAESQSEIDERAVRVWDGEQGTSLTESDALSDAGHGFGNENTNFNNGI